MVILLFLGPVHLYRAAVCYRKKNQDGLAQARIEAVNLHELDRLVEYYADKEHPGVAD